MIKKLLLILLFAFLPSISAVADIGSDVLDIGAGARAISLGRTYSCLKEDSFGMFGNPASLAGIKRPEIISMYGQMNTDVRYSFAGVAIPTEYGAFGIGFASNKTWDLSFTTLDATGRVQPLFDFDYGTDIYTASYQNMFDEKIAYGLRLKYIRTGTAAISGGQGSGLNADAGIVLSGDNLRVGAVLSNVLPGELGALKWENGTSQTLNPALDIGISYKLQNIRAYTELPFRSGMPLEPRVGFEANMNKYLDIRAGVELKSRGSGTQYTNYSAGVGVYLGNIRADYAFSYDGLTTANSKHFVSISVPIIDTLGVFEAQIEPAGNTITTAHKIKVKGRVNPRSDSVMIGNKLAKTNNGYFECEISLIYGKNAIEILVLDAKNRIMEKHLRKVLRLRAYDDIGSRNFAKDDISYLSTLNIVPLLFDTSFSPNKEVNRSEIVAFVGRSLEFSVQTPTRQMFADVPQTFWAAPYIEYAAVNNWIKTYSANTFRPNEIITRAEAIHFIVLAAGVSEPELDNLLPFEDVVPGKNAYAREIAIAKKAGIIDFIKENKIIPEKPLTRADACRMIARIPNVKAKIIELLDFSKGY